MQSLWMLAASVFFALMGMFIKLASGQHSLSEIVLFRGLPSVALIAGYAFYQRLSLLGSHLKVHARRNLSGICSMWLGFYSLMLLPQGTASALKYTSPLFIAIAMIYVGYFPGIFRAQWLRFGAIFLGFIGVLLVFNPMVDNGLNKWALFLGLVSGFMGATAYLTVRSLGKIGEPEWRTVLLFSCTVVITGALGVAITGWSNFTFTSCLYLLGVGLSGFGGQICMTRAFGRGSATLSAVLQYSGIIFSAILGYLVWGETIDGAGMIGIAFIIVSGLAATLHVQRSASKNFDGEKT